jgi:hypothetical protein
MPVSARWRDFTAAGSPSRACHATHTSVALFLQLRIVRVGTLFQPSTTKRFIKIIFIEYIRVTTATQGPNRSSTSFSTPYIPIYCSQLNPFHCYQDL